MPAHSKDLSEDKHALRVQLRARRRALTTAQRRGAARRLARQFVRWRVLRKARHVALYLAMPFELDTGPLRRALTALGVTLYAPRLRPGRRLRFVRIGKRSRRHAHGMQQPTAAQALPLRKLDLLLMPLLGFDAQGHRLGQGGGYYDRTLSALRGSRRPQRIGIAYACQQLDALPVEPHDQALHAVLTERGLRRFPHRLSPH